MKNVICLYLQRRKIEMKLLNEIRNKGVIEIQNVSINSFSPKFNR